MSEDVRITELHMKAGEPIRVVAEGSAIEHLACLVGQAFIESGAPNYVAINVTHDELGPMEVMVRRTSGKTVAQIAGERGERLEKVRSAVFAYGENNLGTDVPFFFKQWGEWLPWTHFGDNDIPDDPEISRYHAKVWFDGKWEDHGGAWMDAADYDWEACHVGKVGKKRAGRLLDGREWNEFPGVA